MISAYYEHKLIGEHPAGSRLQQETDPEGLVHAVVAGPDGTVTVYRAGTFSQVGVGPCGFHTPDPNCHACRPPDEPCADPQCHGCTRRLAANGA